jgi:uncharacterized protein YggT (Ycf19 family)
MDSIVLLIAKAIDVYIAVIIVRALLSWFSIQQDSPFFAIFVFIIRITEPVLGWVRLQMRKLAPNTMFDISPIIVIILLNMVKNLLLRA